MYGGFGVPSGKKMSGVEEARLQTKIDTNKKKKNGRTRSSLEHLEIESRPRQTSMQSAMRVPIIETEGERQGTSWKRRGKLQVRLKSENEPAKENGKRTFQNHVKGGN